MVSGVKVSNRQTYSLHQKHKIIEIEIEMAEMTSNPDSSHTSSYPSIHCSSDGHGVMQDTHQVPMQSAEEKCADIDMVDILRKVPSQYY